MVDPLEGKEYLNFEEQVQIGNYYIVQASL